MHASRLSLVGRVVVALLAVFAFAAIAATTAQAATEGPFWTVEGSRLKANETREITVKAVGSITLEAELLGVKAKVICPAASVNKGAYFAGSEPKGAAGTSREIAEFGGGCTTINNGSACKVTEPIKTEPIINELVISDNEAFGPYELVEFKPESGTKFVELKFTGTCTLASTEVKGEVLGELFTDPGVNSGKEEQITTSKLSTSFTSYLLRFPDPGTSVWLLKTSGTSSVWELVKPKKLEAFGNAATLTGQILVVLAGSAFGKKYGSEL
jgi:hypothetical protein